MPDVVCDGNLSWKLTVNFDRLFVIVRRGHILPSNDKLVAIAQDNREGDGVVAD
jgi:hypothetical protein